MIYLTIGLCIVLIGGCYLVDLKFKRESKEAHRRVKAMKLEVQNLIIDCIENEDLRNELKAKIKDIKENPELVKLHQLLAEKHVADEYTEALVKERIKNYGGDYQCAEWDTGTPVGNEVL